MRQSPAKLNLFLEVTNRRDDGYHELQTVMLRTKWHDQLEFRLRADQRLTLSLQDNSSPAAAVDFPLDQSNLILQAATSLQKSCKIKQGADILVSKYIPAKAGLAGGSSNAATTLLALNQLWQCHMSDHELHQIAAKLGSDLNFFLPDCAAALCTGRGEYVHPITVANPLFAVAVKPNIGNATGTIFQKTQIARTPASPEKLLQILADPQHCNSQMVSKHAFNRLTVAAQKLNPAMHRLLVYLQKICNRRPVMTGSGSTCFVLFDSSQRAKDAENSLQNHETPEWQSLGVLELAHT